MVLKNLTPLKHEPVQFNDMVIIKRPEKSAANYNSSMTQLVINIMAYSVTIMRLFSEIKVTLY